MLGNVGMGELVLILLALLLIFGGKRIPEIAKGLGKSLKSFKEGLNEASDSEESRSAKSPKKTKKK